MASNKELQAEIRDTADAKGVDLASLGELDRMNNGQLSAALEKLKKQQAQEAEAREVADAAALAKPAEEAEEVHPHHAVAKGVSITSKRGILAPGAEVKPEDFGGGEAAFKRLVALEKIVYVK